MKQCSNISRRVHNFEFRCRNIASVEICYNKESARYEPYCAYCFAHNFTDDDFIHERWLVKEIEQ